jgi:DNA repair photolyase
MMAPIIPSIKSHEILPLVKTIAENGAYGVGYTMVLLNGVTGCIFADWIKKGMPDRAYKVLHQIAECHGGNLNDSEFGPRMKSFGNIAERVSQQFKIARKKYLLGREMPRLNCELNEQYKNGQSSFFN